MACSKPILSLRGKPFPFPERRSGVSKAAGRARSSTKHFKPSERASHRRRRSRWAAIASRSNETAYEKSSLTALLTTNDIELLAPGRKAILPEVRDEADRWRKVLTDLAVSEEIGTGHVLKGFERIFFLTADPSAGVVQAAHRVMSRHLSTTDIFGVPLLRASDGTRRACAQKETTSRSLVFSGEVSQFSERWGLADNLHDIYGASNAGKGVRDWLSLHAAYTTAPSPETELAAFAEKFASAPAEFSKSDLRELRDRFALLSDRRAAPLGPRVGAAIFLNGWMFEKSGRRPRKISPCSAYLPKTLNSEHSDWPEAADELPGITWLSAQYDEHLKLPRGNEHRRGRDEHFVYRGARKFLMLLGAECAPRLVKTTRRRGIHPTRAAQLAKLGAEWVEYDFTSPDLERVIEALPRFGKRDRRLRSAALMRALSRHWDRTYRHSREVPAEHEARKYYRTKGKVFADWLCALRDKPWVAVSNGELRTPGTAVVRNAQTETLYETASFIAGLEGINLSSEFASALDLIIDVRASDLVKKLEEVRLSGSKEDAATILQLYRALAKLCPEGAWGDVGDMNQLEFKRRFGEGRGLICLQLGMETFQPKIFSAVGISFIVGTVRADRACERGAMARPRNTTARVERMRSSVPIDRTERILDRRGRGVDGFVPLYGQPTRKNGAIEKSACHVATGMHRPMGHTPPRLPCGRPRTAWKSRQDAAHLRLLGTAMRSPRSAALS